MDWTELVQHSNDFGHEYDYSFEQVGPVSAEGWCEILATYSGENAGSIKYKYVGDIDGVKIIVTEHGEHFGASGANVLRSFYV